MDKDIKQEDPVEVLGPVEGCRTHERDKLPSKIAHIKNSKFLDNAWDPVAQRYVKEIRVYKITKLDREKNDMVWQYFRNRSRNSVSNIYKLNFEKKIKVIYFGDPVQHFLEIDKDIVDVAKEFDKLVLEKYKLKSKEERRAEKEDRRKLKELNNPEKYKDKVKFVKPEKPPKVEKQKRNHYKIKGKGEKKRDKASSNLQNKSE
jgi:hypothetical protein